MIKVLTLLLAYAVYVDESEHRAWQRKQHEMGK